MTTHASRHLPYAFFWRRPWPWRPSSCCSGIKAALRKDPTTALPEDEDDGYADSSIQDARGKVLERVVGVDEGLVRDGG